MPIASISDKPLKQEQQDEFDWNFNQFANKETNNVQSLHPLDEGRIRAFKDWCNRKEIVVGIEAACDKLRCQYQWSYRSIATFVQIMDGGES